MACYAPIPAYQGGAEPPRLYPPLGTANLELPCGKCIGCRTDKASQWALRCKHEMQRWQHNIFLTLTYDDAHLPTAGHLAPRHLQLFLKRLRKRANSPSSGINCDRRTDERGKQSGIRYLACGEYGERTGRPHYHLLLFNCGFSDGRKVGGFDGNGELFSSETLGSCWTDPRTGESLGGHKYGEATPASAAYIAQYTLKKQYVPRERWYEREGYADEHGEWHIKPDPFLRMSLNPAIGKLWVKQYGADLQKGYITRDGRRLGIPRYYKDQLKKEQPHIYELLEKNAQQNRINNPTDNNNPKRRQDAETIHKRRKQLTEKRTL